MERFFKTEAELYPIAIDFTNRLPTGATIASATGSAINTRTGLADNTVFDNTSLTVTTTTAKAVFKLGNSGDDYEASYSATLSDGSILVEKVLMQVRG